MNEQERNGLEMNTRLVHAPMGLGLVDLMGLPLGNVPITTRRVSEGQGIPRSRFGLGLNQQPASRSGNDVKHSSLLKKSLCVAKFDKTFGCIAETTETLDEFRYEMLNSKHEKSISNIFLFTSSTLDCERDLNAHDYRDTTSEESRNREAE